MVDDKNKIINYYNSYYNMLKRTYDFLGYKLKYNYCDKEFLNEMKKYASIPIPDDFQVSYIDVQYNFYDCFLNILNDFNNEELMELFKNLYSKTNIVDDSNLDINECRSFIIPSNDNSYNYLINIPKDYSQTNILYAALAHEFAHFFTMVNNQNQELYEYSEVLSIFFEYLMYEYITPFFGYQFFVNNRLAALKNNFSDLKDDLRYANNPHYLDIPSDMYSLPLADAISYSDGLEYVLLLIDKMNCDNKKDVYNSMAKVALGLSTFSQEAKRFDIDTSSYNNIKKLIKK